jgi:Tol biopolymer transport system component
MSPDARFIVFESASTNLAVNDTNGFSDIFLRDIAGGFTRLISINAAGTASGNSASTQSRLTPDGNHIVFQSDASDLVPNDTNRQTDIFLRDVQNGTTEIVSVPMVTNAITSCTSPVVTPDARYVAFVGAGTNLVVADVASSEIYIRDRAAKTTIWASTNVLKLLAPEAPVDAHADSYNPSISEDGRFVFFKSSFSGVTGIFRFEIETGETKLLGNGAFFPIFTQDDSGPAISNDGQSAVFAGLTNLYRWDATNDSLISIVEAPETNSNGSWWRGAQITADGGWIAYAGKSDAESGANITNGWQVFLADRTFNTSRRLTAGTTGSTSPPQICLANDGSLIAYDSSDGALVEGDENEALDVFVESLPNGPRELISYVDAGKGAMPLGSLSLSLNEISADGRFVLYSTLRQMTVLDTNRAQDIYVRDLDARTNRLVTLRSEGGGQDLFAAFGGHINSNGTRVVFVSRSANFVANDTNGVEDVFVRDLTSNTTIPVSVNAAGNAVGNGASTLPTISADGRYVAFQSFASDLVTNIDQNNRSDIFVRDLVANTTTLVSADSSGVAIGGTEATGSPDGVTGVTGPLISPDGRYVLFDSTNYLLNLRDLALNSSTLLWQITGPSAHGRFSTDGKKVLISSFLGRKDYAVDLPSMAVTVLFTHPGTFRQDTVFSGSGSAEVYYTYTNLYFVSLISSNTTLAAQALPTPGVSKVVYPSGRVLLDDAGRFIIYSDALFHNRLGSPENSFSDIFLYDSSTQTNLLLSRISEPADGPAVAPMISANGRVAAFQSGALNLSQDAATIGSDIYVYRISGVEPNLFRASILESLGTGEFIITWESVPGAHYRVEFKPNLLSANWSLLSPDISADGPVTSVRDSNGSTERYYRIQKMP